jgi:hypothetical protein
MQMAEIRDPAELRALVAELLSLADEIERLS